MTPVRRPPVHEDSVNVDHQGFDHVISPVASIPRSTRYRRYSCADASPGLEHDADPDLRHRATMGCVGGPPATTFPHSSKSVSAFAVPHIGQVIVEAARTCISQAKTNPSTVRTAPRDRAPVIKAEPARERRAGHPPPSRGQALGAGHGEAVAKPIELLGVDPIDRKNRVPTRLRRPGPASFRSPLQLPRAWRRSHSSSIPNPPCATARSPKRSPWASTRQT